MASGLCAIVAEVFAPVPALFRNLDDAILSLAQILPIRFYSDGLRVTTTQSDDGNRIEFCCWTRNNTGMSVAIFATAKTPARNLLWLDCRHQRRYRLWRSFTSGLSAGSKERNQLRRIVHNEIFG